MGYHIILNHEDGALKHYYVEKINDLANFQIQPNTIIYQGDKKWTPEMVKNSVRFQNFAESWHRAGIKAQEIFKKQALENQLILEELSHDQESFKAYTKIHEQYLEIKRGDFLLRNVGNLEIDVKCRTFYKPKHAEELCFDFSQDHLNRHLNMEKYTKTSIAIALYERIKGTDNPKPSSLRMIEVSYMNKIIGKLKLEPIIRHNSKGEKFTVYQIPLKHTMKQFTLLEHICKRDNLEHAIEIN